MIGGGCFRIAGQARGGPPKGFGARPPRRHLRLGCQPDQHGAALGRSVEAVKNEEWAGGLGGAEWNYDKFISVPAGAAPAEWASHRLRLWARPSLIGSTGGCMSIFRPMAI